MGEMEAQKGVEGQRRSSFLTFTPSHELELDACGIAGRVEEFPAPSASMKARFLIRLPLLLASLLLLCQCSSPGPLKTTAPSADSSIEPILISTNRAGAGHPGTHFSGERSGGVMNFGVYDVAIPPNHKPGRIERPRNAKRAKGEKHFVVADRQMYENEAAFRSEVANVLKSRPNKNVAIFIHGYNVDYAESVFVSARMMHDTQFDGAMMLFSWPSRGKLWQYIYDKDSMMISRDALMRTVQLTSEAGAEQIYLIAHSMGSMLTMETLRQAKLLGNVSFGGKLKHVILASPDISVDVFKSQLRTLGTNRPDITVLLARDDKALIASTLVAGNVGAGREFLRR